MANKKIENWTLWIIRYNSNAFVCLSRTWDVIITIFNFTILAISAYLEWRKILNKSNLQL
jgi:nicotinamide mononucleotide transporter